MFACQLQVTEMKIVTTTAGVVGPIFSLGHMQGQMFIIILLLLDKK